MSDSIFHRIFSSPDIIPTHIFILFYFCEWVSVCLSLFICYFTLFPFTLSSFTAPFVSGSTFLAFEKRFSLCLRSPVQTTSLLYLFDIFFSSFVYYVELLNSGVCTRHKQSTMHTSAHEMECCVRYLYEKEREKWNQSETA